MPPLIPWWQWSLGTKSSRERCIQKNRMHPPTVILVRGVLHHRHRICPMPMPLLVQILRIHPLSRIGVEIVVVKVGKVEKESQVVEKAKVVMVDEAKEIGMTTHGVVARERGRGKVPNVDGARGWGMGPPTVPLAV